MITCHHVLISTLRNGENVWGNFIPSLIVVDFHGSDRVDWVPFVGVDGDTEQARVGLKHN